MNLKKTTTYILTIVLTLAIISCTEEDDEPCIETVCPDGFNSCYEKPCDF